MTSEDCENIILSEENIIKCEDKIINLDENVIRENKNIGDKEIKTDHKQKILLDNEDHKIKDDDIFLKPDILIPIKSKRRKSENKFIAPISNDAITKSNKCKSEVETISPVQYKEPSWSGLPTSNYNFEVIKGGVAVGNFKINKPYTVIGRSEQCDIKMDHPSVSRYHCIIQYKVKSEDAAHPVGMYIYDLKSSHGTWQNRNRIKPYCYSKLNVGHIIKLGTSTRMLILQGPNNDEGEESPYTVTELKKMAEEKRQKQKQLESKELIESMVKEEQGISWGMGEDAVEEDGDLLHNPFATNEELSLDDPKKTLRGWFEREGHDLPDYQVEEITQGHFSCKLQIPLMGNASAPIVCMVEHKGKKKDTVAQCALEACRIIDRRGLLRQATHEALSKRRHKDLSENDFYDSDEDEFLDRTGDIERKRKKRKSESKLNPHVETFDSLQIRYNSILEELSALESKIKDANAAKEMQKEVSEAEDLDEYMNQLGIQMPDRHKLVEWKLQVITLEKEETKVRKLLNVARPYHIEEFKARKSTNAAETSKVKSNQAKNITFEKKCSGVHKIFLEDEDSPKLKLSRLDDDNKEVKPVPYTMPQKNTNRYQELLKKREEMMKKRSLESTTSAAIN